MDVSQRQQSEFNDAVGYLGRLNALFYMADDSRIAMDMHRWFNILMAIDSELSTEMKTKEDEHSTATINSINPLINKLNKDYFRAGKFNIDNTLYMKLHNYDRWLRKIQKSAGLLLRVQDDPSFALQ